MIQSILFDLDGTIINSEEGIIKSARYALEKFGIKEDNMDVMRRFIGPPLVDSFQELFDFSMEQAKEATRLYRERYQVTGIFEMEAYPQIEELLKALKKEGIQIALATSKPEKFAHIILEHLKLLEYFDVVTGSLMDGTRDRKEDVLRETLERLGNPEISKVWMVGDRKYDVIGAKAVGMKCVGVTYGFAPKGELKEYGADFLANTPMEILEVVRREGDLE